MSQHEDGIRFGVFEPLLKIRSRLGQKQSRDQTSLPACESQLVALPCAHGHWVNPQKPRQGLLRDPELSPKRCDRRRILGRSSTLQGRGHLGIFQCEPVDVFAALCDDHSLDNIVPHDH